MNKSFKKVLIVLVILVVVGYFSFPMIKDYMVNNLGKRDIKSEQAAFTLKTKDIVAEYVKSETEADKKFINKPIVVSGVVTSVSDKEVVLDEIGICKFLTTDTSIKPGQTVNIKGRVVGYDDLMGNVNLDQCSINK